MDKPTGNEIGASRFSALRRYIAAGVVLCIGIALSILVLAVVRGWEQHHIQHDFERVAEDRIAAVRREVESHLPVLEAMRSFYGGSHEVERSEFRAFVTPLLRRHPDIQALEWIPRVPHAQREEYEAAARRDGSAGFQITDRREQGVMIPSPQREEYFPVYFVEPLQGNERAVGFDLASSPTRLATLKRSRDTGRTLATGRARLVQETGRQFGFLMFVPVYRKGAPTDTVEDRRENLQGFALGVFRIGDAVAHALKGLKPRGIDIQLLDRSADADTQFLHFHSSRLSKSPPAPDDHERADPQAAMQYSQTFDVAGREWAAVCTPAREFLVARATWQPWASFAASLLLTCSLAAYVLTTALHSARMARANQELSTEITERERAERERERLVRDLGERVKELQCTYGVSQLVRKQGSLEKVFRGAAALIPPGWQYPEITRAKVIFDGQVHVSGPFEETRWKQSSDIVAGGNRRGVVEVYYLQPRPEMDEGPFVKEERDLIDALAYALGEGVERNEAEEALQRRMDELERFNRLAVRREGRMIELKREVNELARKAGIAPPYDLAFADQPAGGEESVA